MRGGEGGRKWRGACWSGVGNMIAVSDLVPTLTPGQG